MTTGSAGGPTTGSGPVHRVLAALAQGAHSRSEVAARTGLDRQLVDSVVDHLIRQGRLQVQGQALGCPESGCGACPSGRGSGPAECAVGSAEPGSRNPVALILRGPHG